MFHSNNILQNISLPYVPTTDTGLKILKSVVVMNIVSEKRRKIVITFI